MKGIIIAAGSCRRLSPLTDDTPKCMLKIAGKTILENMLELFRENGIKDIGIVVGHAKGKITYPGITKYENLDYSDNNILHSLMFARRHLESAEEAGEDVLISYSDIIVDRHLISALMESKDDIAVIVDIDWEKAYEGRSDHPVTEAENVVLDNDNRLVKIGKDVITKDIPKSNQGEFIGLWKFTPAGIRMFLRYFDAINGSLRMTDSFQNAKEWRRSYVTDIFQEMIDNGEIIRGIIVHGGWNEFDTVQDYIRLKRDVEVKE